MKYQLKMEAPDGRHEYLDFDSKLGTLTRNGVPFDTSDLRQSSPNPEQIHKVSPDSPGRKVSAPKVLKIQLGLKCNYSCSYCNQASEVPGAVVTNKRDAVEFLANLDSWLQEPPERIELWGGEPLVYLSKLKVLVPEIRDRFPDAQIGMITNGSLLKDETVDFIIDHQINVGMSHDAYGQAQRGDDPLQDDRVLAAVHRLVAEHGDRFSINSVITGSSLDMASTIRYFQAIFGPGVQVLFEDVVNYHDDGAIDSNQMTSQQLAELSDNVFYGVAGDNLLESPGVQSKIVRFLAGLNSGFSMDQAYSKCGMDRPDHIACDLAGNIVTCQNVGASGRHLVGSVYKMEGARLTSSLHFSHRKNCQDCPVLRLCGGGCMYLHGDHFQASCKALYQYNMGYLRAALYLLTGLALVEVTQIGQPSLIPCISSE